MNYQAFFRIFFAILILSLNFQVTGVKATGNWNATSLTNLHGNPHCGDVSFKQAYEIDLGSEFRAVVSEDFDNDGRVDIATTSIHASIGLSIIRNLGDDNYAARQDFPLVFETPTNIYSKDLDADGKRDIVLTYFTGNKMSLFRNTSTGPGVISFAPRADYLLMGNSEHLAFGDVDGDGVEDIIAAAFDTQPGLTVFRNISSGTGGITLAPRVDITHGSAYRTITLADFDSDGKLDVALARQSGAGVMRNLSSGPGNISFAAPVTFSRPNEAWAILAGDFNGDGKADLASVNQISSDNVSILRNTSSGVGNIGFAAAQHFFSGPFPAGGIVKDFDGDGKIDIATLNGANSVSILQNTTPALASNFTFAPRPWDFGVGISPFRFSLGDMNADGKIDLVVSNREGYSISILENNGVQNGVIDFIARKDYVTPRNSVGTVIGVTDVATGDFDGDGDKDIAIALDPNRNVFKITILRNDGTGHFPSMTDVSTPGVEANYLEAGDFDNDGRTDLVYLTLEGGFGSLRNTSNGTGNIGFSVTPHAGGYASPVPMKIGDFDADGKQDVLITYQPSIFSNQAARVLHNNSTLGAMSFSETALLNLQGSSFRPGVADLNLDNKAEIFYQQDSSVSNAVTVQHNTSTAPGQISFTAVDVINPGVRFGISETDDFDGDGKIDLLGQAGNDLSVLRNITSSPAVNFAPRVILPLLFSAPRVIGDFDGDSKKDAIVISSFVSNSFITVLKNTSQGESINFIAGKKFATNESPSAGSIREIVKDDFDNNGLPDLVSGFHSSSTGSVSVLLNNTCRQTANAPFDFDGDGKTDLSIYRPSANVWWYLRSIDNADRVYTFGGPTDVLTPADYTGDGRTDVAFFRPSTGEWFVLRSEDNAFYAFTFGAAGDVPAPADFDGDGKADAAVFRPSNATWYILKSSGGIDIRQFGADGDVPTVADYDGDGKADIGVYRPSNGTWWIQRSTAGPLAFQFGAVGDQAVQGDYTGDGKTDIAVFRPSTGEWFVLTSETFGVYAFSFGANGDLPAPGDYDGDGKTDAAIFRPSTGTWFALGSTSGVQITQFGAAGDKPVPASFIP